MRLKDPTATASRTCQKKKIVHHTFLFISLRKHPFLRALRLFAAETFRAKRPQRRRAWRNGSFRRLFISLPFLHDYDVKMPNIAIYGERSTPGEFANT